ncbi:MAG: hypothetical protein IPG04_17935 [Polyangiaceae bacterium]|nr:hypothetical protein [Polyangiaceae bacterium]
MARAVDGAATGPLQGMWPAGRLIHPDVDAEVIAQVVSTWTGVPVGKLRHDAIGSFLTLEASLAARVRGQPAALAVTAETLQIAAARLGDPATPPGVLLLVGPSGVGKTGSWATALADTL